jgi:lysozyme family protein
MSDYTTDENFQAAIIVVLKHEGGYVNDPTDSGGETCYGISKRVYPDLDIKNLTEDQAKQIYYKDWWIRRSYYEITNCTLATKVFDTAVNIGATRANIILQRCLNVNGYPNIKDDGDLGPMTIRSINACDPQIILTVFRTAQANYYKAVVAKNPKDAKFLKGWLARAAD